MAIQENDFIELDYTGKIKESGVVFDTTNEDEAKKAEVHNAQTHYTPVIICVGKGQLLKGLEQQLIGKEIGTFTFSLSPENAFGKKDAKLLKLVPATIFLKQGVHPVVGLQVTIDGAFGTIRTAGGRTVVDFNHPLAGHDIEYVVTIKRIVTDKKEQLLGLLDVEAHLHEPQIEIIDKKAMITLLELPPEPVMSHLFSRIKELLALEATFEKKATAVKDSKIAADA